jgi:hypothetical protein
MIAFGGSNVNSESWAAFLSEFVFDPPSYGGQGVEGLPADVDAGQLVKTLEILDNMMRVGGPAHVGDS